MYQPLSPCQGCARHVLRGASVCPFCATAMVPTSEDMSSSVATRGLSRAAVMLLGGSLMVGCGSNPKPNQPDQPPSDDGGMVALYGAPAPEPPPTDGAGGTTGADVSPGPPDDDGSMHAEYGVPAPRPEASTPPQPGDPGTIHALYGVPAPKPD